MKNGRDSGFPSRDAIVAYIRANPGKVTTRDIARQFGLKNADRAELKQVLRELASDGTIKKQGKKVIEPAVLPAEIKQLPDLAGYAKTAYTPRGAPSSHSHGCLTILQSNMQIPALLTVVRHRDISLPRTKLKFQLVLHLALARPCL